MSRHHILPPIIYTPTPLRPKETRRKRGVCHARGAGSTDETGETEETSDVSRTTQPRTASALPQQQSPVESAERRVPSPNGKLSDDTLKAMLEALEKEGNYALRGANALRIAIFPRDGLRFASFVLRPTICSVDCNPPSAH